MAFLYCTFFSMTVVERRGTGLFLDMGAAVGALTEEKNAAYGDSFARSGEIMQILYPYGITPDQYRDALGVVRVIDKLFRIATRKDAFGESPWRDIAGYGVVAAVADEMISGLRPPKPPEFQAEGLPIPYTPVSVVTDPEAKPHSKTEHAPATIPDGLSQAPASYKYMTVEVKSGAKNVNYHEDLESTLDASDQFSFHANPGDSFQAFYKGERIISFFIPGVA